MSLPGVPEKAAEVGIEGHPVPATGPARVAWLVFFALVLVAIGANITILPDGMQNDVALYLHTGELLLQGKRPYLDFIDLNPPLIMYLNVVPVAISRVLPGSATAWFMGLSFGLVVWSAAVVWRGLERLMPAGIRRHAGLFAVMWAGHVWYTAAYVQYGQREQLFLTLFAPFLMVRWLRWEGASELEATGLSSGPGRAAGEGAAAPGGVSVRPGWAFLLGVLAGVGVCLKPYFLIMPVLLELWWLASTRRWRLLFAPEVWGLVAAGLAYGLHFLLLPLEVREAFFDRWVPLVSAHYGLYHGGFSRQVHSCAAAVVVTLAVAAFDRRARPWLVPPALLLLGGVAIYLVQRRWFLYHAIPMWAGAAVTVAALTAWLTGRLYGLEHRLARGLARRVPWLVALGAIGMITSKDPLVRGALGLDLLTPFRTPLVEVLEKYSRPGDPVVILSTSVFPTYPAIYATGRTAGSRYLWMFPIPMFYDGVVPGPDGTFPYRTRETAPPDEARFLDELVEDIQTTKPPLVVIYPPEGGQAAPRGFSLVEYAKKSGLAARALRGYQHIGLEGKFDIYLKIDGG